MPYLLPWRALVGLWTMRWSIAASISLPRILYPDPLSGNGAAPGFDPLRCGARDARVDARRCPAHIQRGTRTTHRACSRRISLPSPESARAEVIGLHSADGCSDVGRSSGSLTPLL